MLDIKFIRENKDLIDLAAKKKCLDFKVDELLALDDKRRTLLVGVESRRAEQNAASSRIASAVSSDERVSLIAGMKTVKIALETDEATLKQVMIDWQNAMLRVPNIPDMSVPDGESDAENKEIRVWGDKPTFRFEPKDHIELMTKLGLADFERGSKVHGFRGYFLVGDGVKLCFAIWNYALDFFSKKNFTPILPPVIVRKINFFGTGYLPQGEEDMYKTQDGDYLAGTAEVPLMGMHNDETLLMAELPKRYLGFSPCYRREAGAHGKDTNGLIRVNEFYKFEQVIICEANHETSVKHHEEVNRNTEEFIESLGIPYRTVINCGGDLGLGQVKKYDIELWVPKEKRYREISSASYFHDFQTRRLNIRYRDAEGILRYTHSLNSTAIPTPRILVSLIENYQQDDGTIKVPEPLVSYLGKESLNTQ
ncbi:MAG: serine--tRNA ligase [Candidatus Taylorbacteria bacterium RIFCSPHIGHO2_02_FULL_45_28]|uniref:Serine--tRNA ligase n=1 Tax=Candidatus Taylorbacteria bacterium RIFCSPHIGHO2_12_FULL_45_16 TaxID=1802315 RepID=A0A1G2MYI3_9BACT|nr:MAG: serine--tRNA ligase [Candidatus Taylorbacteria bacterium RIFCSPHIGHO2_01_FULL_44_110]OHA25114.1 MAG: serine--tRNA ligase [Candidatus Taylorbacteria bacterium RIFCSPHIGHO2_02_FULL_45_28]OHA28995.1 MAG: serine--tRNA ligase [Candidatus Taylorbacteria bacterium RIFCSPHIGHO2_12_FULL_45_16]OHA33113.1 MAG: serine--tRNA ligase [Candidatus Taylorbacteria bacterium RIFCSPLOWO2_01_FULL_45_59]OHA39399.1 MAG: serine--tRNA ligase [Candidatus Taylorbacteria bacterium RIFCSPLOWO2_02_FULL_45_10b]